MLSAMFDVNQGLSIGSMLVLMLCAAAAVLRIKIGGDPVRAQAQPA